MRLLFFFQLYCEFAKWVRNVDERSSVFSIKILNLKLKNPTVALFFLSGNFVKGDRYCSPSGKKIAHRKKQTF